MKKVLVIAGVLAALVGGVLIAAATRPDTFVVKRSILINAPPDWVFPLINNFMRWRDWSPWEKKDPQMKRLLVADRASGPGAVYKWRGNKDVGEGSMEIAESVPPSRVRLRLDFVKPFEAHNDVIFTLEPRGQGTEVTWTMQGRLPYFARIVHLFFDMDATVGRDFETGLANLKKAAEGR
jgi:hypothetical protein